MPATVYPSEFAPPLPPQRDVPAVEDLIEAINAQRTPGTHPGAKATEKRPTKGSILEAT